MNPPEWLADPKKRDRAALSSAQAIQAFNRVRAKLANERLSQAQAQYAKLEDSQAKLSNEVTELSSPGGIEADLREKYHAVTPGESVAVIVDSPSGNDSNADQSAGALNVSTTAPAGNWWHRFLDFFGL